MSVVVLTGASRGIGRATALALAARNCRLALLGRPSAAARALSDELTSTGAAARWFDCDLRATDQIEASARAALDAFGAPDALIHDAGVIHRASLEQTSVAAWNEQLDVNLRAPFVLSQAFLPALRGARRGRIVFVGSITSTLGARHAAAYCASKWGLVGLMKSLAEELTDSGVSTVAVLPGSVDTEMLEGSGFPPRMRAAEVAQVLVHHALDAPAAHNGGIIEMFGT